MSDAPSTPARPYAGQTVAFLTQHGKERLVGPVLEAALGCRVERVSGVDTDTLGTFTREVPRAGTQLDAARRKAQLGLERSGGTLALGSEGAFGPDPVSGLLPWNVEVLLFLDAARGLEVVGVAQGPASQAHQLVHTWAEGEAFARRVGFPEHQLVVRPLHAEHPALRKDLATWGALEAAFVTAHDAGGGPVFLEVDGRAHANATRREVIRAAAEDLAARLRSACPACGSPGFWVHERASGLPCAECGTPTRETLAEVFACPACPHRETRPRSDGRREAEPGRCDVCNP